MGAVGVVEDHVLDDGVVPVPAAARGGDALALQCLLHGGDPVALLGHQAEDAPHEGRGLLVHDEVGPVGVEAEAEAKEQAKQVKEEAAQAEQEAEEFEEALDEAEDQPAPEPQDQPAPEAQEEGVAVRVGGDAGMRFQGALGNVDTTRTVEGTTPQEFKVRGVDTGFFATDVVSANAQKMGTGRGTLTIEIVVNGEVVKQASTSAEFGVAQVASSTDE